MGGFSLLDMILVLFSLFVAYFSVTAIWHLNKIRAKYLKDYVMTMQERSANIITWSIILFLVYQSIALVVSLFQLMIVIAK